MTLVPLLCGVVAFCCFGDPPDRPPPLTFDKHVDYNAWCNEQFIRGRTENSLPLYMALCPDKSGRGGFRQPEGAAKEQSDQIGIGVGIWEARDYPALDSYLQGCAPHLDVFRQATQLKHFWQPVSPDTKPLLAHLLPTLSPSRDASKMTIMRAWMKQENQAEAIADAHRIVLRAADHSQQNGLIIAGFLGMAERVLVYKSVLASLREGIIAGKDIKRAYKTLRKYDPGSADWIAMLNIEWAMLLDALQFAWPDGQLSVDGRKMLKGYLFTVSSEADMAALLKIDARATSALVDQRFVAMQRILGGSISEETCDRMREYEERESSNIKKNAFTRLVYARFSRGYQLTVKAETERRGTMLTLAINAHHAKHGRWPTSLKKIDKKLGLKGLKKLRRDPFSGKSFKYKIKNGEPLLYSIGADGKDDGGRHEPDEWGGGKGGGDFVFWPQPARPPQRP